MLHSDEAFKLYLTALVKSGHTESVTAAAQRREALLLAHPKLEPLTESLVGESASTQQAPLSRSQAISQAVLADSVFLPATQDALLSANPVALTKDFSGSSHNPIHVTVSEGSSSTSSLHFFDALQTINLARSAGWARVIRATGYTVVFCLGKILTCGILLN